MDTTRDLFLPETLQHRIDALLSHGNVSIHKARIIKFLLANQGAYTNEIVKACDSGDPGRRIRELNQQDLVFFGLVIRGKPAPRNHRNMHGEYRRINSWNILRVEDA